MYGGAKVPDWVVDRWLELIKPEAFVFAYGSSERVGSVMMTGEQWANNGRPTAGRLEWHAMSS